MQRKTGNFCILPFTPRRDTPTRYLLSETGRLSSQAHALTLTTNRKGHTYLTLKRSRSASRVPCRSSAGRPRRSRIPATARIESKIQHNRQTRPSLFSFLPSSLPSFLDSFCPKFLHPDSPTPKQTLHAVFCSHAKLRTVRRTNTNTLISTEDPCMQACIP
jgi:hypothetical protein